MPSGAGKHGLPVLFADEAHVTGPKSPASALA